MALTFRKIALRDLREIRDYIAEDNPDAARRFVGNLRSHCGKLEKTPFIGRPRTELREDLRSIPFGSYIIFYRVSDTGEPQIMRVLHGSRDLDVFF